MQTGLEKNLFGNHPVSLSAMESRTPPPAFSSDPLVHVSATGGSTSLLGKDAGEVSNDIVEIDGPSSHPNFTKNASPSVRGILLVSSQILELVFKVLSFSFNEQMCMVYIVLLILFYMSLVCIVSNTACYYDEKECIPSG